VVIEAGPEFFEVTKRLHNNLHGYPGDGGPLGEPERKVYERALSANARELEERIREGDVVFCHDPQTAGLVDPLLETGAVVVWRCHVGLDLPNDLARRAWDFLRHYVDDAHAYVFSRREFAWEGLPESKTWIVPPSIDAFSPKNHDMDPATVAAILHATGLGRGDSDAAPVFVREDGTPGRVERRAEVEQEAPLPEGVAVVTQVSRWDRLKDPAGVLRGFGEHLADHEAHLLLAGPATEAVADDPEGADVLEEIRSLRAELPTGLRGRTHLACLPMEDTEENAAIVNAVQRRADVVVQKSLAEGFGLTVAEAMWKERPVVASRAGGIQDQIVDGESGLLLDDPRDLESFGAAVRSLVENPWRQREIGMAARRRVRDRFLGTRHLIQYLDLLALLLR
jgi:trehalose synthase